MNDPLVEMLVGPDRIRAWATDRGESSVHPERVEPAVLRERQRSIAGGDWVMVDQVHGTEVFEPDPMEPWAPMRGRGDVIVTTSRDVRLAVWAGDCAPIALASNDGVLVAAHAGWRGLAAGVVDVAVEQARSRGGDIAVAILGPVIHPCCYEFGADDLDAVAAGLGVATAQVRGVSAAGRAALDVPAGVAGALARHGIRLDLSGPCTGCDDRWFSHRVRGDLGRHALVVERVAA